MGKQRLDLEEIYNQLYAMSTLLDSVSSVLCTDNDKLWFGIEHISNVLLAEAKRIEAWCDGTHQIHFVKDHDA